ncbi:uncharacterized protein GGS22DRAFT_158908 [Annulohypoxylon maeteangense]|uniref:uncharacterized protein n=1 Tax=Annulohypoxylon maeteangense TaxID=1927788 RepID=UPI002008ADD0|nr:uncharacterized protein GGS22DRAFT_158908 [Annulohypoxylon maeteangense]KAI0886876.1 hypothetical protein GGS22DRAFT_158908 [Annulohypoxylon maeteangense]
MYDFTQNRSISDLSQLVKTDLSDLKEGLEGDRTNKLLVQPNILEDALDRFLLWAGNTGALQEPTSMLSLDHHLSIAPEIWEQTCEVLKDLLEAINDLAAIFKGRQPNRELQNPVIQYIDTRVDYLDIPSSPEPSDLDEAHAIVEVILQYIQSLIRIGKLIEKTSPRDRFEQALQRMNCLFPASFDATHARHTYPKLCKSSTQTLVERIGNANAKRRKFIKYCRDHKARLEIEDDRATKQSGEATTLHPSRSAQFTHPEWDTTEDEDRSSLTTASTTFESAESYTLPTLRELSADSEPFECPICFTLQSFSGDKAWKLHAYCDLKAYVCTIGGPECEDELFANRNAWFQHELKVHRSRYVCGLCGIDSGTKATMIYHIECAHRTLTAEQIPVLAEAGRVVPTQLDARDCPFCDEWAREIISRRLENSQSQTHTNGQTVVSRSRFKRHVATHQEQLAIFVISTNVLAKEVNNPIVTGDDIGKRQSEQDDDHALNVDKTASISNAPGITNNRDSASSGGDGIHISHIRSDYVATGKPDSSWRWQCCSCMRSNQSYIYNNGCTECGHRREDSCCESYVAK